LRKGWNLPSKINPAVFIDRDGTLIVDKGYLGDPEGVEFIPNAIEALRILNGLGYIVVVVSNQSGVARGFFTIQDVERVNQRVIELAEKSGARIDAIYYCPHYEGGIVEEYAISCNCRKPAPGLLFRARDELNIDLRGSFVVGDKEADIELAKNVGARGILVLTGYGHETLAQTKVKPDYIAKDILDAAEWIKRNTKTNAEDFIRR